MKYCLGGIIAAVLLSGCGGGGGSNAVKDKNETVKDYYVEADRPALSGYEERGLDYYKFSSRTIALVPKDGGSEDFNRFTDGQDKIISSGKFLSYTRFAVLDIPGVKQPGVIYIGMPTHDDVVGKMGGKAMYEGKGLHLGKNSHSPIETAVTADIDFSVRKGKINVSAKDLAAFSIDGKIEGARLTNGKALEAHFYGKDAKELGGQYWVKESGSTGVFGVSKK